MRVIVNQSSALGAKTGIGHYTLDLLRALRALAPTDTFDVFPPNSWGSVRRLAGMLRPSSGVAAAEKPAKASWKNSLMGSLRELGERALTGYLGAATWWNRYDLYHEPNYIPLPSSLPTVATVHDLSVLLHPQWHPADRVAFYERHFEDGLKKCAHLLAVSEFTRQEIIQVLRFPPDRVTCTHNGVRPGLHPMPAAQLSATARRLGLPERYLLFVGTIEPRKNPLMLMRAYADLPAALRERCPLVLAGSWGWNAAEFAAYYESTARHRGVILLGYVRDDDLAALYGAARALVFPSFYEGFGLPPLEMMACGGAVLASTAGAVMEVVGHKAHLLAPDDLEGWRAAMQRIIVDDDWHAALRDGVTEWAAAFSWERCARQTLDVYQSVLSPVVPKPSPRQPESRQSTQQAR